jgi:hypothetical protein
MPNPRVLIVSYDLKATDPSQSNYDRVFEILKGCPSWCHYIDSTWLVLTEESPRSLAERIFPSISAGDRIFVTEMGASYWGSLPKEAWEWIKRVHGPPNETAGG